MLVQEWRGVRPGWSVARDSDDLFVHDMKRFHVLCGAVACAPYADRTKQVWVGEGVVKFQHMLCG